MQIPDLSRRSVLKQGGATLTAFSLMQASWLARAFPVRPGDEVIAWLDQPGANPSAGVVENLQPTESIESWLTPTDKFFQVAHYNKPVIGEKAWSLEVSGLVERPVALDLAAIRSRPRRELAYTLECAGNHGFPWFTTGIGNARWAGTPLAPLLKEAGVLEAGREVVFWGSDSGEEEVRGTKMQQNFARSMSLDDAMNEDILLCYEMNGRALPAAHGFPLRLIAPGWYGIANVKWLERIELRDTRYMGRFMARDYVTLREEPRKDRTVVTETSVGRSLLKSMPTRVSRNAGQYQIAGMAWGRPISKVEVRVDDSPWTAASIDRSEEAEHAWKPWSIAWMNPVAGMHSITSRATDTDGNVQPAMDDPRIARKRTYWESNGQVTRRIEIK